MADSPGWRPKRNRQQVAWGRRGCFPCVLGLFFPNAVFAAARKISPPRRFFGIKKYLEDKGIKIESAALVYKSKSPINLRNETEVGNILDLIEELEENDDIVNVFAAFDYV